MDAQQLTVFLDLDGTLVDSSYERLWHAEALPNAKEVVRFLRRQGHRLALYSMGDYDSRIMRLKSAGIPGWWFDAIYAVPRKDPDTFERVMAHHPGPTMMVGDSWRFDVAPALGRADAVVWIQGHRKPGVLGTPADLENYPVTVIDSIGDLPGAFQAAAGRRYDKAPWLGYWERWRRENQAAFEGLRDRQTALPLGRLYGMDMTDDVPPATCGLEDALRAGDGPEEFADRARRIAEQVAALRRDVEDAWNWAIPLYDLDTAEQALLGAADALDGLAELWVE